MGTIASTSGSGEIDYGRHRQSRKVRLSMTLRPAGRVSIIGLIASCSLLSGCQDGQMQPGGVIKSSPTITKVVVRFQLGSASDIDFVLREADGAESLVIVPLRARKPISHPGSYGSIGCQLLIEEPDGITRNLRLFQPWGTMEEGGAYFTADLRELGELLRTCGRNIDKYVK